MDCLGDPAPTPPEGRECGVWYVGPAPERHLCNGLHFVRLTAAHAKLDHAALMSSVDYLRMWSDSTWPPAGLSVAENANELAWHDEEHRDRVAFTYSVQDATGGRVLGCLYLRPLRDMLRTRGVEPPSRPSWPGGHTPCVRGWVRRDEPADLERRVVVATLTWLTGPAWELPSLWWVAGSADRRQLALLDELEWSRELRAPGAAAGLEWVLRAP